MALSVTGTVLQLVSLGSEIVAEYLEECDSGEGKGLRRLDLEGVVSELALLKKALADSTLRTSTGCLDLQEQRLEDLVTAARVVAGDLAIKKQRALVDIEKDASHVADSHVETVRSTWVQEDAVALEARLSGFKTEMEIYIFPWLKRTCDVLSVYHSDEFETGDPRARLVIEILMGKRPTCSPYLEAYYTGKKRTPTEDDQEHLADILAAIDTNDKPTSGPPGPAGFFHSSKPRKVIPPSTGLLQEYILESLSFSSMKDRQNEVAEAHRKTFEWMFEGSSGNNFLKWLVGDDEGGIYWINGKAGSGKSTLMRFIYDHERTHATLKSWAGTTPLSVAGFFFWTSGSFEQRSQSGLLRYLLFQLLDEHRDLISVAFPELWRRLLDTSTRDRVKMSLSWSLPDLLSGLRSFLRHAANSMKVCLFIDGLDEFDGDHGEIIDLFKDITNSDTGSVKACLSSRPWPIFEEAFQKTVTSLKLQDLTRNDMVQYVEDKLNREPRVRRMARKDAEAGQRLMEEVVKRADGVFLWVTLVVRTLLAGLHRDSNVIDLLQHLDILPTDLDELFRYLLFDAQQQKYVREASRIFQLIRAREIICEFTNDYTGSSLSVWDLALTGEADHKVAIEAPVHQAEDEEILVRCQQTKDLIDTRCAGLLVIHHRDTGEAGGVRFLNELGQGTDLRRLARSKVTYLHRTVRDFLVYSGAWRDILSQTLFNAFDSHICLLRACVLKFKLSLGPPEQHRRLDEWWPDIVIAMTHARYCQPDPTTSAIQTELLNALNQSLSWYWRPRKATDVDPNDHWACAAFGTYEVRNKHKTVFHDPFLSLATKFGLARYVQVELRTRNTVHKGGIPLLSYAVEFLMHRRHTVFPLSTQDLVSVILEHGMDPNQTYYNFSNRERTPWLLALDYVREANRRGWVRYYDIDPDGQMRWVGIMKLFLKHGADPHALIKETRLDPSATALEVATAVHERFGSEELHNLREMLDQAQKTSGKTDPAS